MHRSILCCSSYVLPYICHFPFTGSDNTDDDDDEFLTASEGEENEDNVVAKQVTTTSQQSSVKVLLSFALPKVLTKKITLYN